MRMLSDSSLAGAGDQGSLSSATASPWAWTASQGQVTPDGRISSPAFDAHRALILAALLCALAGAVISLHSLLHCARHYCGHHRRGRRSALPTAGLKKSVIRRMPVEVYVAAECAICLGEFEDGDAVRLLPRCRHGFHVHCIDTWLSAHSSCPIFRDSLLDDDEGATAATAGEETTAWLFAAAMLILP